MSQMQETHELDLDPIKGGKSLKLLVAEGVLTTHAAKQLAEVERELIGFGPQQD